MVSHAGRGRHLTLRAPSAASPAPSSSGALAARHLTESEQLCGYLEVNQAALQAAELEVEIIRTQLVDADGRVAGKSSPTAFASSCLLHPASPVLAHFVLPGPELEIELQALREAADVAASFVRARGGHREEHLLNIPERVRDVMELGVHHGAAVAVAATQVRSGHELRHLVGFPKGEGAANHDRLVEEFDEAADAVVAEVLTEEVIHEATYSVPWAFDSIAASSSPPATVLYALVHAAMSSPLGGRVPVR